MRCDTVPDPDHGVIRARDQRSTLRVHGLARESESEGYNICGFRYGTLHPNEWMVFGAHFDVAPPINALALDPHVTGVQTYGMRVGAYDNTAGTSMVLEVAEAMANVAAPYHGLLPLVRGGRREARKRLLDRLLRLRGQP